MYHYIDTKILHREVRDLTRHIVIPQKRGKSQRITIPMDLLKDREWLSVDCYVFEENEDGKVVVMSYSEHLEQHYEHPYPRLCD